MEKVTVTGLRSYEVLVQFLYRICQEPQFSCCELFRGNRIQIFQRWVSAYLL